MPKQRELKRFLCPGDLDNIWKQIRQMLLGLTGRGEEGEHNQACKIMLL